MSQAVSMGVPTPITLSDANMLQLVGAGGSPTLNGALGLLVSSAGDVYISGTDTDGGAKSAYDIIPAGSHPIYPIAHLGKVLIAGASSLLVTVTPVMIGPR